jgi:predicted amidohydrolase YtcJ
MTSSSLNSSVCLLVCLTQVVTRRTRSGKTLGADQCVSPIEALRSYTIDNAYLGL